MLWLLKKNISQLRFCIKENDSISMKLSASNPMRILWHMAHLQWSVDWRVWPVATSMGRCCFPRTPGVTVKKYKFASYNKNISDFANLLAISFPQAGKQNLADASPDDATLMSIIYAIYLI